ncbi:hypothetical protein SteCoe_36341 [Stentor coeruleus]|uniref:mRNA guanylyltransferase n=1 Tax=Stentor coeruleus TaxID=5963 RepID=A0A1R2AQC7_9CILI|nr:hypothetical protein SteCoe_36341 [Stentor coeruleus]
MINLEEPGKEILESTIKENLKKRVWSLFEENSSENSFNRQKFPGSHPVSFAREHLVGNTKYLVCEKSDGVRYLLFIPNIPNSRGVNDVQSFLIDRKYRFWRIYIQVPSLLLKGDSIFDVELVLDHETNKRILIFDTLFSAGICFMRNNYFERLQSAWYSLVYPVREAGKASKVSVEVYLKDFFETTQIDYLWHHIMPKIPHKCDGLIFTAVDAEYILGSNPGILKWKPCELNTLDFHIKVASDNSYELCTLGRNLEKFSSMSNIGCIELNDGDIVECNLVNNKWNVLKKRSDKSTPNSTEVAQNVLKSINDNVSIDEIISVFQVVKRQKIS